MKRFGSFLWLLLIFLLALIVRFYAFQESIIFSFDEARDAFISTAIYTQKDLKLIGPPATGNIGLFHGPLYWYFLGPLYLAFRGSPEAVSACFRLLNAFGVFPIFIIASSLFTPFTGLLAALLYAVSYEQSQYAIYVGNPALGVLTTLMIFLGAVLIYKKKSKINFALPLMFVGAAVAAQLNLMFFYFYFTVVVLLLIFRKNLSLISLRSRIIAIILSFSVLSTYILAELKYSFRTVKLAISLVFSDYNIISSGWSKYQIFFNKFLMMYHDNLFGFTENKIILTVVAFTFTTWMIYKGTKDNRFRILLLWMFSWIFLMLLGGHMAYYTNVGNSLGIIIAASVLLSSLKKYCSGLFFGLIIVIIVAGNFFVISRQSPQGLISDLKPQPGMKLADEKRLMDIMYQKAEGRGFTVRLTGIPYKIQTLWAYLFRYYGLKKYDYLPYWETGNTLGFPGTLPPPKTGTTCLRFLVREPMRGIPVKLVDSDVEEENLFSDITNRQEIGGFVIESRKALSHDCHDLRGL